MCTYFVQKVTVMGSRRYPFVGFKPEREIGNDLLQVENVSVTIDGKKILDDISFNLNKEDKVAQPCLLCLN